MNEGCATWVHQRIMTRLHETGQIDDAAFLEVLHSTSNVIGQWGFDKGGAGFNPYALGYAMMSDIERMCREPTKEDREWFPRHRRQWRPAGHAAPRLGQLPRREFHSPIPLAGRDAPIPHVPPDGRHDGPDPAGGRDPRRCRLPRHPPQPGPQLRSGRRRCGRAGGGCRTWPPTAS